MKIARNVTFCLLVVCFLALVGCDKKADESKPPNEVKTEADKMSVGEVAGEKAKELKTGIESLNIGGRIDRAKWSEGKAIMGTISTAIRVYGAEMGVAGRPPRTLGELGFVTGDLEGTYFGETDLSFSVSSMNPLTYIIVCTPGSKPNAPAVPAKMTLNQAGSWTSD